MSLLRDFHEEYIRECTYSLCRSEETIRGYKRAFELLERYSPEIKPRDLSPELMTNFFEYLSKRKQPHTGRIGLKASTIVTYRSKLSSFFTWLENKEEIKKNPFNSMKYPNVTYTDTRYLKQEDVERIFTTIMLHRWPSQLIKKRNLTIIGVSLYCGLRKGEIIGLRVIDVDLKRGLLTVVAETSKSKRERVVPINRKLVPILEDYLEERRKSKTESTKLFISNTGTNFTKAGLKHLVARLNELSGVRFHMHRFRHTFAVNVSAKGGDIFKIKELLGHTDIRMTNQYLRGMPREALAVDVERVDLRNLV